MRLLLCALTVAICPAGEDAREIVRRSVNLGDQNLKAAQNYTFRERNAARTLDGSGNVTKTEIDTYDVTLIDGSPYKRLIARNDKPLPEKDERREKDKLRKIADQRRKETPSQRENRIAEYNRKREQQRAMAREILDAFDFRLANPERLDGRDQYVIEAVPRPDYRPHNRNTAFFPKVRGKLWIDRQDYHWTKIDAEVIDTIAFGAFLVRLSKGSHLEAEQVRVNDEVWLPRRLVAEASARLALVKKFRGRLEITYDEYRKFQTDSRIVSVDQVQ
jgi:hypothetical protein